MRLTLHVFLTLDGVMQAPGGVEHNASGVFERGGWQMPYVDRDMTDIVQGWYARADALLLGRTTYLSFRSFWPGVTDPNDPLAAVINGRLRYVVSNTLADPDWDGTTVLTGNPVTAVQRLKDLPGAELQLHGSARLASALHAAGLMDEYRLPTFPVTVGAGMRLFAPDAPPTGFQAIDHRTTATGAVYTALTPKPFHTGTVDVRAGRTVVST